MAAALYALLARVAFGSRLAALLAGLLCAFHPFWVINVAEIDDGVLASFLLAACLFLGVYGGKTGGVLASLLYGLALAGLALVRAALLPFAFVGLLWYLARCRSLPRGWLAALLAFLGFVNGLVPWGLRNYQVFGEVVPVVDATFVHLWMGNNPLATGGPMTERAMLDALAQGQGDAGLARQLAQTGGQPERYRLLAGPVAREVRDDPAGSLQRRLAAGLAFLAGENFLKDPRDWQSLAEPTPVPPPSSDEEPPAALPAWFAAALPSLLYGSLLAMLLLGALGWRWSYAWRVASRPLALAVVWVPLPYLLSHAESLSGPRLPLDGVLWCLAGFALACLVPGVRRDLIEREDIEQTEVA